MFKGQEVIVVMPAYNAEKTYNEVMDQQIVDELAE